MAVFPFNTAQDFRLSGSHLALWLRFLVVIPQKVKHPVNDEDGYFFLYRVVVLLSLYHRLRVGNNHFTNMQHPVGRGNEKREVCLKLILNR